MSERPPDQQLPTAGAVADDVVLDLDELVDEVGKESFPASDPPPWWAGEPDLPDLAEVPPDAR